MKKIAKWVGIVLAGLLLILIITNPGIKQFKDFKGVKSYEYLHRERNWIIFSIYYDEADEQRYVGIFMNFFEKSDE